MGNNSSKDPDGTLALPRRDFIMLGSVAVAGVAASGLSAEAIRAVTGPIGGSVLSIGFTEAGAQTDTQIVRAQRLSGSDRDLATRGARVTIRAYSRPEERRREPLGVDVTAFHPVSGQSLPVAAWSFRHACGVASATGRTSFNVAPDADGGVTLGIERKAARRGPAPAVPARRGLLSWARRQNMPTVEELDRDGSICRFTAGRNGVPLRAGTYVIALGDPSRDHAPDWSSVVMEPNGTLVQPSIAGRMPVAFEYLTLTVAPITA